MLKTDKKFGRIFFKILGVIIILLFFSSLIMGFFLNENFFLRFSLDKSLEKSTINRINNLKIILLWSSLFSLVILSLLLFLKNGIEHVGNKKKDLVLNLLVLVATLIIFILIGEILLRVLISSETNNFNIGPGVVKFNKEYVHLNSKGFRDEEFFIGNESRIISLGDSFTFGWGIKNVNDTYSKLLEKKLNLDSKKRYEVLNFGVPGKNTEDELNLLKNVGLDYKPDIVIIGYVLNDFQNVAKVLNRKEGEGWITLPYLGFFLRDYSYLYYFLETRLNWFLDNAGLKKSYDEDVLEFFDSETNRKYNSEIFKEIKKVSEKENFKVLVVVFPMIYKFDNYPFLELHDFVKMNSEENGFYFIDLLEDYKKYKESELIVNKYDRHPNEIGHRIAAEKIDTFLKRMEL